jgi:hypothetical protein
MEKTKAAAETVGHVVSGTVGEIKDRVFGTDKGNTD